MYVHTNKDTQTQRIYSNQEKNLESLRASATEQYSFHAGQSYKNVEKIFYAFNYTCYSLMFALDHIDNFFFISSILFYVYFFNITFFVKLNIHIFF